MMVPGLTGAAVIVDSDGTILLVKHSFGKNNGEICEFIQNVDCRTRT